MFQSKYRICPVKISSLTLALLGLTACGEGTLNSTPPAELKVVSSNPVSNATKVGIDKTITINFSESLNPATVSSANFMLMPGDSGMTEMDMSEMDDMGEMDHSQLMSDMGDMSVIPGEVTCDYSAGTNECTTIKFTPKMSLAYGQQYHIMVHDVETSSGQTFSGEHVVPVEFTTAFVMRTERERNLNNDDRYRKSSYSIGTDFTTGRPIRIQRIDSDNKTTDTRMTQYNVSVGNSGRSGDIRYVKNSASEIDRYSYRLIENGRMVATVNFNAAGDDGLWGTEDDLISSFTVRGEDHGAHRLTTSYRAADAVAVSPLALNALKANTSFSVSRASLSFYDMSNGQPRLSKSIRFRNFGANGIMDINMQGNKTSVFDDDIDEYQVYEYDPVHKTRLARKEYEAEDNLSLNFDGTDILSGYRIYRTASAAAGNAAGMLRIAEVTYRDAGNDGLWYNVDGFSPNAEDDNNVRDYELNFYCNDALYGRYEKFEIEVDAESDNRISNGSTINTLLASLEPTLLNYCQSAKPTLSGLGITGDDTLEDIDTSEIF